DLQNPPEEIPRLIAAIRKTRFDVIYGRPDGRHSYSLRSAASWLVNRLFFRVVFGSMVYVSSFRILRRKVVDAILSYHLNFTYVDGLLAWNTRRIGQVTVEHHTRASGRSGYSL